MKFDCEINTIVKIEIADFAEQLAHGGDDEQGDFLNAFCNTIEALDQNTATGIMQSYSINEKLTNEAKSVLKRMCKNDY